VAAINAISASRTAHCIGSVVAYTRPQLDRILSALSSAGALSLSAIARAEGLTKQTVFRIKAERTGEDVGRHA
jgi:hypothetical protein